MKKSLYHIETEYLTIINQVEELDGELTPELEEQLTINQNELQSKSIAYLEFIGSKEALNIRVTDEIKRLQAIKKSNDNLVSNLKNRLLDAVKLYGDFTVGLTKFGTRKSSSIHVEDVNSLPKSLKVVKVTEEADKKAIKLVLQAGGSIEGCEIVQNINLKIN